MSTGVLAFVAGKVDLTSPYLLQVPLLRDVKSQMPQAICEVVPLNVNRTLIINRDEAPFDKPDLRRAMALSLDRKAFIDILTEGKGDVGGVMLPPPEGIWSMPPEILKTLLSNGFAKDQPAAVVYEGTLPTQHTIDGTLQELAESKSLQPKLNPSAVHSQVNLVYGAARRNREKKPRVRHVNAVECRPPPEGRSASG